MAAAPTTPQPPVKPPVKPPPPGGQAPKKQAAPKAPPPDQNSNGAQSSPQAFSLKRGVVSGPQRIVIYGPGGVGKSELASLVEQVGITPAFCDIEDGTRFLDVLRAEPTPSSLDELTAAIRQLAGAEGVGAIVVDSLTKAEEFAVSWAIENVPHENGHAVKSVEGYGYGKGYTHVFEAFLQLLQALDAAVRRGKHVIGICHDFTAKVPNPSGGDWIRYEPRLQMTPNGSIRHRVKEWCDHLLYVGFDAAVSKDGKATGKGTRTIYPVELPTHWAKSRLLSKEIAYERRDATIWQQVFNKGAQ